MAPFFGNSYCGCYVLVSNVRRYLPLIQTASHTTILSSSSRTTLTQTFHNPNSHQTLHDASYLFPLYDGVSVVAFTCTVGDRIIGGVVKERAKAREEYEEAVDRGDKAALLEQVEESSDVFKMSLGNVAPRETVKVEVTYLGELKHDAEVDGLRFTIPTHIAPRYGSGDALNGTFQVSELPNSGISITVDAEMPDGSAIRSVQSPSHPISVSIGTLSTAAADEEPSLRRASATLSLGDASLDHDFIIQIVASDLGSPAAVLETHPDFPNHRALMASLVPKFNIPAEKPEIVFVCDRSGSMDDKIPDLKSALVTFLKSMPVGVKFNICSFGSRFSFLWSKSHPYNKANLDKAVKHVSGFDSNFGGTEMHEPMGETFKRRDKDRNLEVFLLTDGQIWDEQGFYELINKEVKESKGRVRVFSLGIGVAASSSLIEGAARAGNGFAQAVGEDEKMDKKVVRMLRGALTPHIQDYSLEIKYDKPAAAEDDDDDDDFELVEKVMDSLNIDTASVTTAAEQDVPKKTISLFDPAAKEDPVPSGSTAPAVSVDNKYDHLPPVPAPRYLQSPSRIPPLYPFNRTTVYVLLSDASPDRNPKSVLLKGTSTHGPLELEIPITHLAEKGTTIHQLAARSRVRELEEGRGWMSEAKAKSGKLLGDEHSGEFEVMVEREAVRLGVKYQVAGRWCSFVAVEPLSGEEKKKRPAPSETVESLAMEEIDWVDSACMVHASQSIPTRSSFGGGIMKKMRNLMGAAAPLAPPPPAPFASRANRLNRARGPSSLPKAPRKQLASKACRKSVPSLSPIPSPSPKRRLPSRGKHIRPTSSEDDESGAEDEDEAPAPKSELAYQQFAALQTFDGSWTWSPELGKTLGVTKAEAKKAAPARLKGGEDAIATLLVVLYLKRKCEEDKDAWEMMVEKAEGWLEGKTGREMGDLEGAVSLFLD